MELKSNQTLLQQTEDKYRFIVEKQTDGVTLGDLDENIIFANPAMDRIFGLTTGTIVGRNLSEFMSEKSFEKIKSQTQLRMKGESSGYELDIIRPNGQTRHVYVHTQPWFDDSGKVVGSFGVVHDETDRRKAEQQIQQQKTNLQELVDHRTHQLSHAKNMWERTFDAVPDIIAIIDTNYRIIRANRALAVGFRTPIKRLIGRKCHEVIYGIEEPLDDCLAHKMLQDHKSHSGEKYVEQYGRTFFISVTPLHDEQGVFEGGVLTAHDISELKQAELNVTLERDRAHHYLDIAAVMIIGLDANGNISLINRRGCEILEYDYDELIGKNWFEYCLPDQFVDEVKAVFNQLMKGETELVVHYENPIKTKSGKERIIAWSNSIHVNEAGDITGIISSGEDITERKIAEVELELSRANYKAIYDNINEAVFVHDMGTGAILDVNPAMTRMYGWEHDEALDLEVEDISSGEPPYTQQDAIKWIQKASQGKSQLFEWHCKRKNGDLFWAEVNLTRTIFDGNDCVLAVVRDINQQKMDSEEIQKFKTISDKANYGAVITELDGTIVYVNRYYADIHGYSVDELIGENTSVFHNQGQLDAVERLNKDLLKRGSYSAEEVWHQYKDGFVIPMLMNAVLIMDAEGKPLYQAATAIDIAMRKQLEVELEEKKDSLDKNVKKRTEELSIALAALKHANRVKSDFLATMNHELRTPLNTILGMAEVLQDNIYGELNPEQAECLSEIVTGSRNLRTLVQDILYLSKLEADEVELQIEEFPVIAICKSCLTSIEETAQKKGITLESRYSSEDLIVFTDGEQIKQLLTNLLDNAVKFTPEGGSIGLEVESDEGNNKIDFTIWENGIGIDLEIQRKIFEPFTRQDTSYTRRYYGTGLGLALVYRIIELQGGAIELESEPNKGSRFTISLPHHSEKYDAYVPSGVIDTDQGAEERQILIVEDDRRTINRFLRFFQSNGHQVTVARNSEETLSYISKFLPDLILLDAQIPVGSGLDVVEQIRSKLSDVPIIAIATLILAGDSEKFLKAGANEFLRKPINEQMLTQISKKYL